MDATTAHLVDYALRMDYAELSDHVVHECKRRIIDTFACAIGADTSVYCWGWNGEGQLGFPNDSCASGSSCGETSHIPSAVVDVSGMPLTGVIALVAVYMSRTFAFAAYFPTGADVGKPLTDTRNYVTAMRDAGVSLLFLSGNSVCWVTPLEPAHDGRPERVISRAGPYGGQSASAVERAEALVPLFLSHRGTIRLRPQAGKLGPKGPVPGRAAVRPRSRARRRHRRSGRRATLHLRWSCSNNPDCKFQNC